jgi:hypothetical protein
MIPPFDIFKRQDSGSARWLEEVADLEDAKRRVKQLAESAPGEYFIFSLAAGHRLDLKQEKVCSSPESLPDNTSGAIQLQRTRSLDLPSLIVRLFWRVRTF